MTDSPRDAASFSLHDDPVRSLTNVFSSGGLVSQFVPGFEERPQQLKMALTVWRALEEGGQLLVEAGTGTGKSLAYLFPALLQSARTGKRVIVSTHTVNLQEQLIKKDIPLVAGMMKLAGFEPNYSMLKGRGHYLCLRRWNQSYESVQQKLSLFAPDETEKIIMSLAETVEDEDWQGDRDSLPFYVPDAVWAEVCSEADRCMSQKCRCREKCYYQRQKKTLEKCHLIVVNHALFVAHLAISNESKGQAGLLPGFDAVILDEAHHLEDVTRGSLGTEVSELRLKRLADDTVRKATAGSLGKVLGPGEARRLRIVLDDLAGALGAALRKAHQASKEKSRLRDPDCLDAQLVKELREVSASMKDWEDLDITEEERFEVGALRKRFLALASDLESINHLEGSGDAFVYWTEAQEGRRRSVTLKRSPLEVGPYLREVLWSQVATAVLTSATLTAGNRFDYIKSMLDLDDTEELVLGSPFDYRSQAILCVPKDSLGRDPNSTEFSDYVAQKVLEIIDLSRGRAFVLFTNKRSLEQVVELIRDRVEEKGYPALKQGDTSRETLLRRFREAGNAVLFGLDSFWEGVDVPGEALSCVVLAKLPFPVPDDPVMEAREELWRMKGLVPFAYYTLPVATLKLKQGFGRLIRTKTDRGAVVLLDPRILTKSYGRSVLKSLPPARFTDDIEEIAKAVPN
ncbi:MAG TPA: ATP-dependent DNA helicase [Firmicutes bacterium]|nr:ATP-dependent DNA helicase [Candidatus Fermentithermobacillaceae bacterium]